MPEHTGQSLPPHGSEAWPRGRPLITVAICTRNRSALLGEAVRSVLPQLDDQSEVLIVENASTDDTPAVTAALAAQYSGVRVWRENELGLSVARNTALRQARGDYVIFLDDDATVRPGWLAAYRQFFSAPPSPRAVVAGGGGVPRFEATPPFWFPIEAHTYAFSSSSRPYPPESGPWGGNSGLHRDTILALGGFSTALGRKGSGLGAHEETELYQRVHRAGLEIWWLTDAVIDHFVPANRVTLAFLCRSQFATGRSAANIRLSQMAEARGRSCFRLGRVLLAPFHCALNLILAVTALPFRRCQLTVGALLRAARTAGFAWELVALRPPRAPGAGIRR